MLKPNATFARYKYPDRAYQGVVQKQCYSENSVLFRNSIALAKHFYIGNELESKVIFERSIRTGDGFYDD